MSNNPYRDGLILFKIIISIILVALVVVIITSCTTQQPDNAHYQLYLNDDSIRVYDGNRWISSYSYADSSELAKDLLRDNDW